MDPTYEFDMKGLESLLHNEAIGGVVKHQFAVSSSIPTLLGMGYVKTGEKGSVVKGDAYIQTPWGRTYVEDIWNSTKKVAPTSEPMTPTLHIDQQVMAQQQFTCQRLAVFQEFRIEELHKYRPVGQMPGTPDKMGASWIKRQCEYMSERVYAWRMALIGAMLRGELYVQEGTEDSGNRLMWTAPNTGSYRTVDYGVPRGQRSNFIGSGANLTTEFPLDPLGESTNIIDAAWSNPSTDIPAQLIKINDAYRDRANLQLKELWMTQKTAYYLMNNTNVRQLAGSVNTPFTRWDREEKVDANGTPLAGFSMELRGLPWVKIRIFNDTVRMQNGSGTWADQKLIPDGFVFATPTPSKELYAWLEGAEPIGDGPNLPPKYVWGMYSFGEWTHNPPKKKVHVIDNGLAIVRNPYAPMFFKVY